MCTSIHLYKQLMNYLYHTYRHVRYGILSSEEWKALRTIVKSVNHRLGNRRWNRSRPRVWKHSDTPTAQIYWFI